VYAGPATADSGCAIGAALHAARELDPNLPAFRVDQCCWGPTPDREEPIEGALKRWASHIESRRMDDPIAETAALLADGNVIGWVQGGAEFGPRALGNRSILADPRPASHKELINAMIKKREGYRPFAPSVIEERAADFFMLPDGQRDFPFMSFVMSVQPEWREQLGAITHVDGTARLQTVSRGTNPRFWALISAFGEKTGIPMLLNTSFNNNAEPIVNTADEAVVCFLDSGLHYLVVGDYLVSRRTSATEDDLLLTLELPPESRCIQELSCRADGTPFTQCWLQRNYDSRRRKAVSQRACDAIRQAGRTLGEILSTLEIPRAEYPAIIKELRELWSERQIRFAPKAKKTTA
jgi:carbamoyltransferase